MAFSFPDISQSGSILDPARAEPAINLPACAPPDPRIAAIVAITQTIFSGASPTFELDRDPEDPGHQFVVVTVEWQGDPKSINSRRLEWHEQVDRLSPDTSEMIRLSVIPR